MCNTLTHRGPDDEGLVIGRVRTRRPARARRPGSACGASASSTCRADIGRSPTRPARSGRSERRIYNFQELREELAGRGHRFRLDRHRSSCLREYGDAFVRLDGMFALAVWDGPRATDSGARSLREETLCYRAAGTSVVASELQALMQVPGWSTEIARPSAILARRRRPVRLPRRQAAAGTCSSPIDRASPCAGAVARVGQLRIGEAEAIDACAIC